MELIGLLVQKMSNMHIRLAMAEADKATTHKAEALAMSEAKAKPAKHLEAKAKLKPGFFYSHKSEEPALRSQARSWLQLITHVLAEDLFSFHGILHLSFF